MRIRLLLLLFAQLIYSADAVAESCSVSTLSPAAGPTDGGTLVNLTGLALGDGSSWACSFGALVVGAEYHDDTERVSCFSPHADDDIGAIPINVSIDGGSSFCGGDEMMYSYYPAPNVSAISPASGSHQGGTTVTVTGAGFGGAGGNVVCTFGSLRVGDVIRAGAVSPATNLTDTQLECIAPSAHASAAVGEAHFSFASKSMPAPIVVSPCVEQGCVPGVEPVRRYELANGHNLTLLGKSVHEDGVIKLTRNLFTYLGAMIVELYYPSAPAGVPVRDFVASWTQEMGRGSGADGYSFVYADLSRVDQPFDESGVGDGLRVTFKTRGHIGEFNEGHGVIEAIYNGSALNSTFMGDKLRSYNGDKVHVSVHKDPAGLSVYFDGVHVLACTVDEWAPQVGWAFGFGARTGDRKDDHWIDDLRVRSGFLLNYGEVEFGVSLNDGHDMSLLGGKESGEAGAGVYTYTSDPSVFSFSPTTGPEQGNTTVRVVGSHFAGGADHRCIFGDVTEMNVEATYDTETQELKCVSPPASSARYIPLEVSLNNRPDSTSHSNVKYRFYMHPAVSDARGPDKHAAPAGLGTNVTVHGGNFTGGDDYRVAFLAGGSGAVVPATFSNDSRVVCVAPPTIDAKVATVALTLNGQQYTEPMPFPFFAVFTLSPSTGPSQGGTLVLVNGTAFDTGGAYRCDFGDGAGVTTASRRDQQTLACYSPAADPSSVGSRPLEVALNAKDFSASGVGFSYYLHPPMASVYPAGGPNEGGTLVAARTTTSGGLSGGSHYLCAFGSTVVPATYISMAPPMTDVRGPHNHEAELLHRGYMQSGPVVTGAYLLSPRAATYADFGAVLCEAPANATATAGPGVLNVRFEVALNGQNFHPVAGGYTYYVTPNITALGPTRGPTAGGTILTLELSDALHPSLLNMTSCRVGGKGRDLPYVHSRPVVAILSPTVQIADGVVQCAVPQANHTGTQGVLSLDFSSNASTPGELHGDASLAPDRNRPCTLGRLFSCGGVESDNFTSATSAQCEWLCPVHDGHLRLTSGEYSSSGSFLLSMPRVPLAPPPMEVNVSFELLIGRAHWPEFAPQGDGMVTINFGQLLQEHIGLQGASLGVSVQLYFLTMKPRIEVWYMGERLMEEEIEGGIRTSAWLPCHFEVADSLLSFYAGRRLVDRLPLPDWAPLPTWRFGWSASTTSQRDEFLLDNVEVRAATLIGVSPRDVELTLNGQQFAPAGSFSYYGAARYPTVLRVSPSSGPIDGGTIVRVAGANVEANLSLVLEDPRTRTSDFNAPGLITTSLFAYRCFLGDFNITAEYYNGTTRCTTLPFGSGSGTRLPITFSVNAQDAIGPTSDFVVYGPTVVDDATPLSGPIEGGTLVEFKGSLLHNGSDYRCRFGTGPLVEEFPGHNVAYASYDPQRDVISCISPPAIGLQTGFQDLYVSLNGQNYHRVGTLTFHYDPPLVPSSLSPTTGPSDGGTVVHVTLDVPLANAFAPSCRFGNHEVEGSIFGGTSLRCESPQASLAPASAYLRLLDLNGTSYPPLSDEWLHGHAIVQEGGELQMTNGEPASTGALLLPVYALNGTAGGVTNCRWCGKPQRLRFDLFRVTFGMRMYLGDVPGGDGVSFSYGLLPPRAVGEYGAGLGLRVSFLTANRCPAPRLRDTCPVLEVRYAADLLKRMPLQPDFRGEPFVTTIIEYSLAGLRVVHGSHEYIPAGTLRIHGWRPTADWSMGFGARSGQQVDVHELRRLSIDLGSYVDPVKVPIEVSLNSQQFVQVDVSHRNDQYPHHGFRYFGSPNVTLLSPTTGPIYGDSPALMLAGTGLHTYGSLEGGSHYRCRFGGGGGSGYTYSPATRSASLDEVYCVAPELSSAQSGVPVALALNGQQYFSPPSAYDQFDTRATAAAAFASPTSGPVGGGTLVSIRLPADVVASGMSLGGGDDYRCRFHPLPTSNDTRTRVYSEVTAKLITVATYFASNDSVLCPSPSTSRGEIVEMLGTANVSLQLAINGMHFEEIEPFEYYEDAQISNTSVVSLSPSSGPLAGGAQLMMIGTGFASGSHANCWLGSGRSNATYQAGGSQLHCISPPGKVGEEAAYATEIRISLNAQQASDQHAFIFYPTPIPILARPDNGHADAEGDNTLVSIFTDGVRNGNATFANGTDLRCRYGGYGAAVTHASLITPTEIACRTPKLHPTATAVLLQVSLNGQQYGPPLPFDILPAPIISEIDPASGVFEGGAIVYVNGANFANRSQEGGRGACKFGTAEATVPSSFVHSGRVKCQAPSADLAYLSSEWAADFDTTKAPIGGGNSTPGLPERSVLLGDATIAQGALVLTAAKPNQIGGLVHTPINRGARYFDARFSVGIGGGLGGDGMSFCYGALSRTAPFDEFGAPSGLCLRLRTHTFLSMEVSCNGTHMEGVRIGQTLRPGSFVHVGFKRERGQGALATFESAANGSVVEVAVSEEKLLATCDAITKEWRFGFGARTGEYGDAHLVDHLTIRSPAYVDSATVPFSYANNGQQFALSPSVFEYFAPPEVSTFSPASGPTAGGTLVTLSGLYINHGDQRFCGFPVAGGGRWLVNASVVEGGGLACRSPGEVLTGSAVPVEAPLEVGLNGQQFTSSGLMYQEALPLVIDTMSPSCGPSDGSTLVNVSGVALQEGSHLVCKFTPSVSGGLGGSQHPPVIVNASRTESSDGSVFCSSPVMVGGVADVQVATNAQQYSPPSSFSFFAPPVISHSVPSSGPTSGGTVVVVHGYSLTPHGTTGSMCDVVCRFGDLLVPAEAQPGGTILCQSPSNAAANGTSLPLYVSLNRQQYSAGDSLFTYTDPGGISEVKPASGPVAGGTQLTVYASDLSGGDDSTCRFLGDDGVSHVVNATYLDAAMSGGGTLVCDSPPISLPGGGYNFSISLNRQQYRTPLPFSIYPSPVLTAASPSSGPMAGGALVEISGSHLAGGDNYTCRWGDLPFGGGSDLELISSASYDVTDDAVRCTLPIAPSQGSLLLRVAHNGQQYAALGSTALPFEIYRPVPEFILSPSSGPSSGGTSVNVSIALYNNSCPFYANDGVCDEPWVCAPLTDCSDCAQHNGTSCGLRAGSDRRCRFQGLLPSSGSLPSSGASLINATVAGSVYGAQLICQSPSAFSALSATYDHVDATVRISLNGQQYTVTDHSFAIYSPPTVSDVTPKGGPSGGGTSIVVHGEFLPASGSDYECEIGESLIPASYDLANATLHCVTPPSLPLGTFPFSVRLNGQETAPSGGLTFRVSTSRTLVELSPSSGPMLGNTTVLFKGTSFVDSADYGELRCRFGLEEVVGTFLDDEGVHCVSPLATYGGAATSMDVDFTIDEHHVILDETAKASESVEVPITLPRMTASGLVLLGATRWRSTGYMEPFAFMRLCQSAYEGPGALLLPPPRSPHVASPWFDILVDIRIWGSASAHGLSFCYGELPVRAWGETGITLGLCVQFDTVSERLLVHNGGRLLHNASLPAEMPTVRNRLWKGLKIVHSLEGGGLLVNLDGVTLLERVELTPPIMPTATWRFGFGARTGPNPGQLEERHDVRNFRATLGAGSGAVVLFPQITLNGQQYVGSLPYSYYPAISVSGVTPTSGPLSGNTYLTVSGAELHGGSDYRCRFSSSSEDVDPSSGAVLGSSTRVQMASFVGGVVLCNSSDGSSAVIGSGYSADERLEISLNGQQYELSSTNFSVHANPTVMSLSPVSGPAYGETVVALTLPEITSNANHTCRFGLGAQWTGEVVVLATADEANTRVLCRSPPVVRPIDPLYGPKPLFGDTLPQVSVEYSLNGQQYTTDEVLFSYTIPPTPTTASPHTGPVDGGTSVRVQGAQLWTAPSPDKVCAFGESRVPASKTSVIDELRCVAPPSILGQEGMVDLRLSLNGQQFAPPLNYTFYQTVAISLIAPASGPAEGGGTQITVSGAGLGGKSVGSHPVCSFTASVAAGGGRMESNATRLPSGDVLCVSPPGLAAIAEPFGAPEAAPSLSFAVSLNGQQFSNETAYRSFRPHNITLLTPDSGGYLGGTSVNLTLNTAVLNASGVMRCRFGMADVPATLLEGGADVRCVSPSSVLAGATPQRHEEFGALPQGSHLLGFAKVENGVLQLTPEAGEGSMVLNLPNLGASELTISFDLLLGDGGAGRGISLVFGPIGKPFGDTDAFGETGAGNMGVSAHVDYKGLEVWIRTGRTDVIQIHYNGQTYAAQPMHGVLRGNAFLNTTISITPNGEMDVSFGAGAHHEYLELEGWAPEPHWKLALGGRCVEAEKADDCGAPENVQWVDNLVITSDALLKTARVELNVAVNGQQYLGTSTFSYNAAWHASYSRPFHGPTAGGTVVTVHGANFHGGASDEYSCRFGSSALGWREVPATIGDVSSGGDWGRVGASLQCVTPPAHLPHANDVELQISSNRQEYPHGLYLVYKYYKHPVINVVVPPAGPLDGNTLVRIYGEGLHGGATGLRRCKMGGIAVPASLDAATGALLCFSPAAAARVAYATPMQVALNVDHFTSDQPSFTYYDEPTIAQIAPAQGFSNGTLVSVTGDHLWRDDGTYCRFGAKLVNASKVSDDEITCNAPPAYLAGAWARVFLTFSEPWASQLYGFEVQLRGAAYTKDGILRLVDHEEVLSIGRLEMNHVGSIMLALPQPALAPYSFRASFKLLMGKGTGADGLSFSYGDLAAGGVGELGAGKGLRVLFRTHKHQRVEVWYGHSLLHVSTPPQGGSLRSSSFVDVAISHSAMRGLTVTHAGHTHCDMLSLPGYEPRDGWRFAIGARSGGESDDHHIDDLLIEAGSAAEPESTPFAVTLNGLQFSSEPTRFLYLKETTEEAGVDPVTNS